MPTLIRLLLALGFLSGLAYGAVLTLATWVEPEPREMSETIPHEKLNKPR